MAKFGAGLDAQRIQSGEATPTPSETLQRVLSKTLGSLSQNMEIPEETQMESAAPQSIPPQEDLTAQPPAPEAFTEDQNLIPFGQRLKAVQEGEIRPTFDQWKPTGAQTSQDLVGEVDLGPDYTKTGEAKGLINAPRDPLRDMVVRAQRTGMMMNPLVREYTRPDGKVVPVPTISLKDTNVTQKEFRTQYMELNKRIMAATTPEEEAALIRERDALADPENRENTILKTYLQTLDAMTIDPQGRAAPDPKFLNTGVVATEHEIDNAFLGNNQDVDAIVDYDENGNEVVTAYSSELLNPSDLAQRVGQNVAKWWAAEKADQGTPVDRKRMTTQQQKDLGAAFLISYAMANPDLIQTVRRKKDETTGEFVEDADGRAIAFRLTAKGQDVLSANRQYREQAMGINLDPFLNPQPSGLKGDAELEKPTFRKKSVISGKGKSKAYATLDEYEEAITNLNSVAHVVDDRRLRIVSVMAVPALYAKVGNPNDKFGDSFGIGRGSVDTIVMEKKHLDKMEDADALKEAIGITQSKKSQVAEDLSTLSLFRKMANYLTHAMQPLAGRLMVQQGKFNPTRKKIIRFVTRSKHAAKIDSMNSMVGRDYMNIMALSFGKDALLEDGRIADIKANQDKYYTWGKLLESALDQAFPKEALDPLSDVIAKGGELPTSVASQFAAFQRALTAKEGQADTRSELMALLQDKGEDAPMAIDALIDFKNFIDNMNAGRPHYTYVNAYVDGKTNGMANQGMMLGNSQIAARVGALRGADASMAVDGGDIRDEMARVIINRLTDVGLPVLTHKRLSEYDFLESLRSVLEKLAKSKDINKKVTMVFPYGKEIPGLRNEIAKLIPSMRAKDPELDQALNFINDDKTVIDAAHDNVVYALFEIFGPDTFKARGSMRAVGFMHAITDNLFSLRGPSGHRITLGDYRVEETPRTTSRVEAKVGEKGTNPLALRLQESGIYMSSAARKGDEPAGHVRGRSAVIPTQSMDSATVARTVTGSSWQKLKDAHPQGEPYVFQIYDAYKVDVNSYRTLVEEVNKNFLDITTRDWNFIEEANKELKSLKKEFKAQMQDAPGQTHTFMNGKFDYLFKLIDPEFVGTQSGGVRPTYRTLRTFLSSAYPIDPDMMYLSQRDEKGRVISVTVRPLEPGDLKKYTVESRINGYHDYIYHKVHPFRRMIVDAYNDHANSKTPKILDMKDLNSAATSPKLINSEQAYHIFETIMDAIKIDKQMEEFTQRSNRNRAELRKKIDQQIKDTGIGVLQFWAH